MLSLLIFGRAQWGRRRWKLSSPSQVLSNRAVRCLQACCESLRARVCAYETEGERERQTERERERERERETERERQREKGGEGGKYKPPELGTVTDNFFFQGSSYRTQAPTGHSRCSWSPPRFWV
jgi:hypothetical protein